MFQIKAGVSRVNKSGLTELVSGPNGPVIRDLRRRGRILLALAKADAPKETGRLARSLHMRVVLGRAPYVLVGSNLRYAQMVHDGTRPHIITPDKAKTLRFKHRGRVIYAQVVHHPGTRPNRYLTRHLRRVA